MALVFLLAVATVTAHAANQSRVFQQGRDGYTGVHDTWISASDWDTPSQDTVNYGRNQDLVLTRDGRENPLLRFDLSAIPANSAVVSATLWLYNTTPSSCSGTRNFPRRVNLFRVLRDWDEGNQVASPVDAPGKHGATGFNAFDYYPGEGADVPWGERGMAPGPDYATLPESHADVVNPGWYSWNVTALVRAQVRGEQANFGLVLRDATGYEDDHMDWRTFISSQHPQHPKRRPKLAISYNPDTPYANAGPDQEQLSWNGGALTLDGSGSRDRPGGDDAGLHYQWSILKAAYGSTMGGDLASGPNPTISFTPDACGEWEIRLVVSNTLGESASDTVRLRLLQIPAGHPRIYLTPAKLADLRGRAINSNPRWVQLKNEADCRGRRDARQGAGFPGQRRPRHLPAGRECGSGPDGQHRQLGHQGRRHGAGL